MDVKSAKQKNQVESANIFEQQELLEKRMRSEKVLQLQPGMSWRPMVSSAKMKNAPLSVMTRLSQDAMQAMKHIIRELLISETENSVSPHFHSAMILRDSRVQRNEQ